jgi:hypothetical protein
MENYLWQINHSAYKSFVNDSALQAMNNTSSVYFQIIAGLVNMYSHANIDGSLFCFDINYDYLSDSHSIINKLTSTRLQTSNIIMIPSKDNDGTYSLHLAIVGSSVQGLNNTIFSIDIVNDDDVSENKVKEIARKNGLDKIKYLTTLAPFRKQFKANWTFRCIRILKKSTINGVSGINKVILLILAIANLAIGDITEVSTNCEILLRNFSYNFLKPVSENYDNFSCDYTPRDIVQKGLDWVGSVSEESFKYALGLLFIKGKLSSASDIIKALPTETERNQYNNNNSSNNDKDNNQINNNNNNNNNKNNDDNKRKSMTLSNDDEDDEEISISHQLDNNNNNNNNYNNKRKSITRFSDDDEDDDSDDIVFQTKKTKKAKKQAKLKTNKEKITAKEANKKKAKKKN